MQSTRFAEIARHALKQGQAPRFRSYPFPRSVRARLSAPSTGAARVDQICNLDFLMGACSQRPRSVSSATAGSTPSRRSDRIGGQRSGIEQAGAGDVAVDGSSPHRDRSTLAIGQSAVIAERTGVITIGDLRVRDVRRAVTGSPDLVCGLGVLVRMSSGSLHQKSAGSGSDVCRRDGLSIR